MTAAQCIQAAKDFWRPSGWIKSSTTVDFTGTAALYLQYRGAERLDFLEFGFEQVGNAVPGRKTDGFKEEKL